MTAKFKILITVFIVLLIAAGTLIAGKIQANRKLKYYTEMPAITDSIFQPSLFRSINGNNINKGDSLFVLFVSSECEYCHVALTHIFSENFIPSKTQLIVVFPDSSLQTRQFLASRNMEKKAGIFIYTDADGRARKYFPGASPPSLYVIKANKISAIGYGLTETMDKLKVIN